MPPNWIESSTMTSTLKWPDSWSEYCVKLKEKKERKDSKKLKASSLPSQIKVEHATWTYATTSWDLRELGVEKVDSLMYTRKRWNFNDIREINWHEGCACQRILDDYSRMWMVVGCICPCDASPFTKAFTFHYSDYWMKRLFVVMGLDKPVDVQLWLFTLCGQHNLWLFMLWGQHNCDYSCCEDKIIVATKLITYSSIYLMFLPELFFL